VAGSYPCSIHPTIAFGGSATDDRDPLGRCCTFCAAPRLQSRGHLHCFPPRAPYGHLGIWCVFSQQNIPLVTSTTHANRDSDQDLVNEGELNISSRTVKRLDIVADGGQNIPAMLQLLHDSTFPALETLRLLFPAHKGPKDPIRVTKDPDLLLTEATFRQRFPMLNLVEVMLGPEGVATVQENTSAACTESQFLRIADELNIVTVLQYLL
jgi:hypothetical protein